MTSPGRGWTTSDRSGCAVLTELTLATDAGAGGADKSCGRRPIDQASDGRAKVDQGQCDVFSGTLGYGAQRGAHAQPGQRSERPDDRVRIVSAEAGGGCDAAAYRPALHLRQADARSVSILCAKAGSSTRKRPSWNTNGRTVSDGSRIRRSAISRSVRMMPTAFLPRQYHAVVRSSSTRTLESHLPTTRRHVRSSSFIGCGLRPPTCHFE